MANSGYRFNPQLLKRPRPVDRSGRGSLIPPANASPWLSLGSAAASAARMIDEKRRARERERSQDDGR